MTRPLRVQYEGAVYHVTCRGNERREIFADDLDRKVFLNSLRDSLNAANVVLYCYVLMENHFHLLVETPLANLSEFMRQFNITYTSYYNKRHKRVGHLYQGRYKSILVEKESYLIILSRYMHLNPVRTEEMEGTSLAEKERYLRRYKWSSLLGYMNDAERYSFIDYEMVLGPYGGDDSRGREAYWREICSDLSEGIDIKKKIVAQSILGSDEFIESIKRKFLGEELREVPSLRKISRYRAKDEIINAVCEETGKEFSEILQEKGTLRQVVMEFLYRVAGLKGTEIGKIMGVDYSTVSQGRKRLRKKLATDNNLSSLMERIEKRVSSVNSKDLTP